MTPLVAYRSSVVTPDTAEALRRLEIAGTGVEGIRIQYEGTPSVLASWKGVEESAGPTELPPHLSMRPTGREVYLSLKTSKVLDRSQELAILWGIAIPLGFMPWSRYPVKGPHDTVFHYLGPWTTLIDFLHGEGRGEFAWPSVCAAAQCDVGKWGGPKTHERSVQSHLHRLGINCGLVDGEVGDRTLNALKSLGLGGLPMKEVLPLLEKMKSPSTPPTEKRTGYFTMSNTKVEAFASGPILVNRTRTGFAVTANGAGRLIFIIGEQ